MPDVAKRMYGPAQPGAGNAVLYTAPATGAVIRAIHIHNTDVVQRTISIAINGTAATAANCLLYQFGIPAGATYDWSGFQVLGNADTIQGLQSSATACTVTISGVEQ